MCKEWKDFWCHEILWKCTEVTSGHWIGVCSELRLTLQGDGYEELLGQIQDILSCELIRQALEASHVHLNIPKEILDKINEANNPRRTSNSRRKQ
jgi:hypothetical protein